jgi:hypothetical protein
MNDVSVLGRSLVPGTASGPLLHADLGLSFWGGVSAQTGMVIDRQHPLHGQCVAGTILAIPSGRGSCCPEYRRVVLPTARILSGRADEDTRRPRRGAVECRAPAPAGAGSLWQGSDPERVFLTRDKGSTD